MIVGLKRLKIVNNFYSLFVDVDFQSLLETG